MDKNKKLEQLKERYAQEYGKDYSKDIKGFVLWLAGLLMDSEGAMIHKALETATIDNQPRAIMIDIKQKLLQN